MGTRGPRPLAGTALIAVLLAAAYAVTGLLGMQLAAPPGNVTPVWLPAGLSLAALLTFGRRVWPGITLGSFVLNVLVFPEPATWPVRLFGALAIAGTSTLGLLLIHWLTQRSLGKQALARPSTLVAFVGWVAIGCAVNASGGLAFTALLSEVPLATFPSFWLTWWLGDVVGVLLIAPLVLGQGALPEPRPLEWAATLVLTLGSCQLVFGRPIDGIGGAALPLAWTVTMGVVWAGARLGAPAVSVHTVLIYALMSWGTLTGQGPFAAWPRPLAMMLTDGLLVVVIVIGQLLASLSALTRSQQLVLEQERANLEARVAERTLVTNRRLLRPLFPESVTLDVTCAEAIGVNIDPTLLDQIILNLAINARDAINGAGKVTLEATEHLLNAADALEQGLREGKWVSLAVTDDGTGIPPEVLPRIFEPFFTTKADGRGTGLGLSTVLGIATQAKGTVRVSSREGQTRFVVWLPASEGPVESQASAPAGGAAPPTTILVVEDEPLVRRTVVLALERAGHRVLTASDGEEGLALLRQPGHGVQLVLTDVIMPRLGGVELARALRTTQVLPVLFMSGFHERQVELEGERVLSKPFTTDQLLSSVELVLRASTPGFGRGAA